MKWALIALFSIFSFTLHATEKEEIHKVKIELALTCPPSDELQELIDTISAKQNQQAESYEEWTQNLFDGINRLTQLVEAGKIYEGGVTVSHDVEKPDELD